jgi:hypothetical protein
MTGWKKQTASRRRDAMSCRDDTGGAEKATCRPGATVRAVTQTLLHRFGGMDDVHARVERNMMLQEPAE